MHKQLHNRPFDLLDFVDTILNAPVNTRKQAVSLPVDVVENSNQFLVYADLPGVSKDNIKIEFDKGQLSIIVESRANIEKQESEKVLLNERHLPKMSRTLHFGDNVDIDSIKANYKDGVLNLVIPKREAPVNLKQIIIE